MSSLSLSPAPSSGGSAATKDTGVAWFTSDGNTSTGDGTPGNPYGPGNGQKAYDAGFRSFYVGPDCDFGNILLADAPANFSIRGNGNTSGTISGNLVLNAWGQVYYIYLDNCIIGNIAGNASFGDSPVLVNLFINPTASVGYLSLQGANGVDDGNGTPADGSPGGSANIYGGGSIQSYSVTGGANVNGGTDGTNGSTSVKGALIGGTFLDNSYP